MANFANPTVGSAYTSFPTEIRDAVTAALQQLHVGSHTNIPANSIKWDSSDNRWKKYVDSDGNGTFEFVDLTSTYAFNAQISATKLSLGDGHQILLGNSNDFEIIHDGANSVIRETGDGSLFIQSNDIIRLGKTNGTEQYIEASSAQIILKSGNSEKIKVDSSGAILPDNVNIRFGTDADLRIFHDQTNSFIDSHFNDLNIRSLGINGANVQIIAESDYMARFVKNGAVELYFDNNKKIETLSNGAKITGALNVNSSSLDSHQAVIEGGVAGTSTSSLALKTGSGANSKITDLSFYSTFVSPTSDSGQRRSADITSGFSAGNWGNEYIAFHIGKGTGSANDTQALTDERVRMNKYGIRVSGNSNGPVNADWNLASGITASGSFGGGIALIDGNAGFIQSLDGLGANYYLRNGATGSVPEINIKAIANGAVELYFDANKKVETKSYGFLAENTDTNILVHNPNNSRGGLAALSTQRVALATTTSGDNIVFGFGSAEPVTSSNFTERFRIENGTGNIQIKNDNAQLQIGADLDLVLVHDGNNSIIDEVGTGVLAIRSDTGINILKRTGDHSMIKAIPDGSVELYFAADRVFYTETRGVRFGDNTRMFENDAHNTAIIQHADIHHAIILRGASNADGSTITNANVTTFREFGNFVFMTGSINMEDRLIIEQGGTSKFVKGSETLAEFIQDGACKLFHDNSLKLETTSSGVTVSGAIFANAGTNNQVHINPNDGSLEISRAAGGAFIDFKNDTGEDNDARIAESNGGFVMSGNVAATSFSGSGTGLSGIARMNEATSSGESQTGSSSVYQDKVSLSITTVSNTRVMLFFGFEIKNDDGSDNQRTFGRFIGTNASFVQSADYEVSTTGGYAGFADQRIDIGSHSGTRTYTIQFKKTSGNNGRIRNAYIVAFAVDI